MTAIANPAGSVAAPADTIAAQVGPVLRELRGGVQRAEMARRLGIARSGLIALEEGTRVPSLERLDRLAAAYGVRFVLVAVPADDHDGR